MPPGVPLHIVYESDGTALGMELDGSGGLAVIEDDGTVLSLELNS